ncbi:MAG: C1 family peptidase [Candidatus Aminicenantes bacterium]|nr:C1 family peptidase [Candidatus Aminicenantes bacterium]
MPLTSRKVLLAALLGALLLAVSPAQDIAPDEGHRTGLLREDEARLREFVETHPRVAGVRVNWLGLERINDARSAQGRPPLEVRAVDRVGGELVSARPGEAAVLASASSLVAAGDLPVSVDNSLLKFFPPIRSQNPLGSCASFSSTYYQLSYMAAFQRDMDIRDPADNTNKYSPKWSYNMLNDGKDEGTYFGENYDLLERHGAVTWADFPYDTNFKAWCLDPAAWRRALAVRIDPVQYLRDVSEDAGLDLLKQLLTNGYVMVFGTYVSSWQLKAALDDPSTAADDGAVGEAVGYWVNGAEGSHGMTVVGYNDAIWTDINGNGAIDTGEKGALRIANSWGGSWRDGGFTWLAYDALRLVPLVAGAPTTPREPAFFNDMVFLLTVRDSYTPLMTGEFTVKHAKRDQMRLSLGTSTTSATTPSTTWPPTALWGQGGAFAFDGSATAVDGTFVLDFTDILTAGAGARRYHLGMRDGTAGDPATLKAFKIVDLTTDPATEVASAQVPKTADGGEQVYAWVDYTYAGPDYNHPPELLYARVSPSSGTPSDTYMFSVQFTDEDGDAPAVRNVYVDGTPHATTYSASDGRYRWSTSALAAGEHSYFFQFEDGQGGSARAPLAGVLSGPMVYAFTAASLSPSNASVNGGPFTLAVIGSGFVPGAVVTWNGNDRPTAFVDAGRLEAAIPASDLALGGLVSVVVRGPGGGVSNGLTFAVENPAPTLASISPTRANGGGADFTLTVLGTGFVSNSSVRWNGLDRPTTFVGATELRAAIPAADIAAGGEFEIVVVNPAPAGGLTAPAAFTVTDFTVEATPASTTLSAGSSGTFTVQLAPRYGSFDASVALRAVGLPRGASASFSPASVTPGSGGATATMTVATTARKSSGAGTAARPAALPPPGGLLPPLALAALLALLAVRTATRPGFPRLAARLAAAGLLAVLIVAAAGCSAGGGGGGGDTGTPAGTYEITVEATSGSLEVRDSVTLVVN